MKIKLRNRLEVLMKDSGISTFEEMADRLTNNQGWDISRSALSRKFRDDNVTLTLKMVEAICNELQCLPCDLFETDISDASDQEVLEIQSRVQPFRYGMIKKSQPVATATVEKDKATSNKGTEATSSDDDFDLSALVGPKVSHLHIAKIKK
jgi:DNA-binding Xre family transcriptional regulator